MNQKLLALLSAFILVPTTAAAQSTAYGTDTRTLHFFPDKGFMYSGGYFDDFNEFDLVPNGQTHSSANETYLGVLTHSYKYGPNPEDSTIHTHGLVANHIADADLTSGKLKAYAEDPVISELDFGSSSPSVMFNQGRSNASLYDTLFFNFNGYTGGEYATLGFRAKIDGSYSAGPYGSAPSGSMLSQLYVGTPDNRFGVAGGYLIDYFGQSPSTSTNLTNYGDGVYGFDFIVRAETQALTIFNLLSVNAYGSTVDYSHTSTLDLVLPQGVDFTSASGVFLTDGVAPAVPETATWAMMIMGVGFVGFAMRRRGAVASIGPALA